MRHFEFGEGWGGVVVDKGFSEKGIKDTED